MFGARFCFAEADSADAQARRQLTPQQRIEITTPGAVIQLGNEPNRIDFLTSSTPSTSKLKAPTSADVGRDCSHSSQATSKREIHQLGETERTGAPVVATELPIADPPGAIWLPPQPLPTNPSDVLSEYGRQHGRNNFTSCVHPIGSRAPCHLKLVGRI